MGDKQPRLIREKLPKLLANDDYTADVRKNLETPEINSLSSLKSSPWTIRNDGVLLHDKRLYIFLSLRISLIQKHHNNLLARYFGVKKTLELLKQQYYWPGLSQTAKTNPSDLSPPGMREAIEDYILSCVICKRSKTSQHRPHGQLLSLSIPTHKWKNFTMDFVTRFPLSRD